ncbi:ankyrin repeat domain-containing protein [Agrobacterium tumefaciens]|uniref:ankyrin repeat domain-containing protein n=1 Tax=Agrobacterium tumefaciens TaxID=358 RepID=UPI0015721AFA|nr:ankyrin repeat domain-containing protein [Agrobacterium tumefaciens]WHO24135.1 ankyrin repeat domain-containing protein [Agrobacterium tumefaciens]
MFHWVHRFLAVLGISISSAIAADGDAVRTFHDAVQMGEVETVRTMLTTEPGLATSKDEYGFQPIHLLDMYPDEEVLNLLLANGADINAVNDERVTILHIVADPDAVPLLVGRGANIEARDERGWTPLIMQANNQQNGPDVVTALLAHGADPNAKKHNGETALSLARETGDATLIEVLIANGGAK